MYFLDVAPPGTPRKYPKKTISIDFFKIPFFMFLYINLIHMWKQPCHIQTGHHIWLWRGLHFVTLHILLREALQQLWWDEVVEAALQRCWRWEGVAERLLLAWVIRDNLRLNWELAERMKQHSCSEGRRHARRPHRTEDGCDQSRWGTPNCLSRLAFWDILAKTSDWWADADGAPSSCDVQP